MALSTLVPQSHLVMVWTLTAMGCGLVEAERLVRQLSATPNALCGWRSGHGQADRRWHGQ